MSKKAEKRLQRMKEKMDQEKRHNEMMKEYNAYQLKLTRQMLKMAIIKILGSFLRSTDHHTSMIQGVKNRPWMKSPG